MEESKLRKLCSDATLHSQKGFFIQWVQRIEAVLPQGFLQEFAKLKTDKDRLETVWRLEFVHSLEIRSFPSPKSKEVANEKRKEGNDAYQANENQKALQLYSQAIIKAFEGDDLSLSYANRSAVLFHMNKFDFCLQDISLALASEYPKRLHYKVYDRQGLCLRQLGRPTEATEAFRRALQSLKHADLSELKRNEWTEDLTLKMANPQGAMVINCEEYFEGRHITANEDIPGGKVVLRERPFCSFLMVGEKGGFCEHCFRILTAPVPCPTCSGVAFCSPECRDVALKSYHKWECPYLNLFKASGMSLNCYLALRVITHRGLAYFKGIKRLVEGTHKETHAQNNSPIDPEDYLTFYNLVALEDQRITEDFFKRTLMAVFLLKVLQHAGFFPKSSSGTELNKDECLIGSLLLRHLQTIQFNAHEVSGIAFEVKKSFDKCKSVHLGLAVYPTASFFNHSCFPAVGRYFNGDEMTIVTLRPVHKGEKIHENYGPIFTHNSREDRQRKLLSRYWFRCHCEACQYNWPVYADMSSVIELTNKESKQPATTLRVTKSKKGKKKSRTASKDVTETEGKEQLPVTLEEAYKDFELGKSLMNEYKREEAIEAFSKWVDWAADNARFPAKDLHLGLQSLRLLVGARGTHYVVPK